MSFHESHHIFTKTAPGHTEDGFFTVVQTHFAVPKNLVSYAFQVIPNHVRVYVANGNEDFRLATATERTLAEETIRAELTGTPVPSHNVKRASNF